MNKKETDKFVINEKENISASSNRCNSKWWNQGYHQQQIICRIIESFYFRALTIFLVLLDISLLIAEIMLESLKIQSTCESYFHHSSKHYHEMIKERIELFMEISHYASIIILSFFVIELLFRIYASGKEFWNIRRKKMEYFDAFVVITSLIIDLYFLRSKKKNLSKKILIFSFRLWRFVRIISSVAESVRDEQIEHKQRLNKQYLIAIHRLADLLLHKTNYVENHSGQLNSVLEHFHIIDAQCQSSLDTLQQNHELTSSKVVEEFIKELNELENKNDNIITSTIFIKSSEV
ncbi:unnamed protein product [Rotaria sp. Silwood2]|nr:unnamed protein product [Rotaria sp. Silwood2]CAF2530109.1 unnamed protein product [Rotaria sp. Silwood2]CAF2942143.1 unnamed protein product [Rotaria sp. Silwood2]CAF3872655.1 unnamed protein product [Rotaria sp. Silwood2]CAF4047800.1 unnamed protein product [Rotaria sp. Silwood2]